MAWLRAVRGPNEWPDAQRAFTASVLGGATPPSIEVWARWWTKAPGRIPGFVPGSVVGALVSAVFGLVAFGKWIRGGPQGAWVALWLPASRSGSPADLVVKVETAHLPTQLREGEALLLGEAAPNGALCLAIGDALLAPIANPMAPAGLLAKAAGFRP